METTNYVEFKKTRDLGTIITDAFKFIRENWKGYFGIVIKIAGPAFIIFIIALGLYMRSLGGMMSGFTSDNPSFGSSEFGLEVVGYVLLAMFAGLTFYVLMQMASLFYIKSYINNNGTVDKNEIITNVKQNFWKFLGFGFLMMIMVMIGAMLCFLPGIYLGVVLSLGTSILVFEGKSVGDTISHCFTLIKDHWWETFGVVLVVGLLVMILGQIFGVPAIIYQFVKMGISVTNNDPTAVFGIFSDPIYLALMVFSYIGQFLLSSITLITSVLVYYDLNEQKNLTGTIEEIDSLGSSI
ncbi:MAG: hypothetical protein L3J14_03015 [Flavobacteriaceae bacterium]|nr:hypothetical protein [Flavobacteriaceae bacterium]